MQDFGTHDIDTSADLSIGSLVTSRLQPLTGSHHKFLLERVDNGPYWSASDAIWSSDSVGVVLDIVEFIDTKNCLKTCIYKVLTGEGHIGWAPETWLVNVRGRRPI